MIIFYNTHLKSSSKHLWLLKYKDFLIVGNEVGVQDLLITYEDIDIGIFWGLAITPFIEESFKYVSYFLKVF